ncbi:hypothetical protein ACWEQG_01575 [Microbispora sp. NPDC004025]
MTYAEIAARLRGLAQQKPTDVWRALHALAHEIETGPDMDALVDATQPANPTPPTPTTPQPAATPTPGLLRIFGRWR